MAMDVADSATWCFSRPTLEQLAATPPGAEKPAERKTPDKEAAPLFDEPLSTRTLGTRTRKRGAAPLGEWVLKLKLQKQ